MKMFISSHKCLIFFNMAAYGWERLGSVLENFLLIWREVLKVLTVQRVLILLSDQL